MSIFSSYSFLKKVSHSFCFIPVIILLLSLTSSCTKEPDNLGRDLLPLSDSHRVKLDSSSLFSSYSLIGKKVFTSSKDSFIIGSQTDNFFGYSHASLLTQFHPTLIYPLDTVRVVDSLILNLIPSSYFGDTLSTMTLRVFEMTDSLSKDSAYFSDINTSAYYNNAVEIGNKTFNIKDTLISLNLNAPELKRKFEEMPDSFLNDRKYFTDYFYGIYITVDPQPENGGFVYLKLSSTENNLLFYSNGDSIPFEMSFTSLVKKANAYQHDYTGFPVKSYINSQTDSIIIIDGLGGTEGRIKLNSADDWIARNTAGKITINKAELVIPVDNIVYPSLLEYDYTPALDLYTLGEDSAYNFLYDYMVSYKDGGTYFGGTYDKTQKAYIFNIAFHLQSFLSGKITSLPEFVLVSRGSNSTANRVILKGGGAANPIKLKVIYTELFKKKCVE